MIHCYLYEAADHRGWNKADRTFSFLLPVNKLRLGDIDGVCLCNYHWICV